MVYRRRPFADPMWQRTAQRARNLGRNPVFRRVFMGASAAELAARAAWKVHKRKRARKLVDQKPRKKSGFTASKKGPTHKVGNFDGMISATKAPANTGVRSVVREKRFGDTDVVSSRAWIGMATTGNAARFIYTIAESCVIKMLTSIGDKRSDKALSPGTIGTNEFFSYFVVIYAQEGTSYAAPGDGAISGANITNTTVLAMANTLNTQLLDMARKGYYPAQLTVFRSDAGGNAKPIYMDQAFGKMRMNMHVAGQLRVQNITRSGEIDGGAQNNADKHAVDANPIQGSVYQFRNRVPIFRQPYLTNQPDPQHNLMESVMDTEAAPIETGINFQALNDSAMGSVTSLNAPPLRPTTIWSNCKKTGKVYFAPGGYKILKTKYGFEGTLHALLRDYVRVVQVTGLTVPISGKIPPTGDSFLMCLMPTIKTVAGEAVRLAYDAEFIYDCKAMGAKTPRMQATNFIE